MKLLFLEWWYWKDIWRLELLNKIQFTPWKNEPIFEKLLICHIFCLFFFEQHKKYNGKNGREKREKHSRVLSLELFFKRWVFSWKRMRHSKHFKGLKPLIASLNISLQDNCCYVQEWTLFLRFRDFFNKLLFCLTLDFVQRNLYLN